MACAINLRQTLLGVLRKCWRYVGVQAAQHDGAEFLNHLPDLPGSAVLRRSWQARLLPEAARVEPVRDTGLGVLYLPICPGASILRSCVDRWHAQHDPFVRPHAMLEAPAVLFICLSVRASPPASYHEAIPGRVVVVSEWHP